MTLLNRKKLFAKIWILHIIVYYIMINFSAFIFSSTPPQLKHELLIIGTSPFMGLIGYFDLIPLFPLIPTTIMLILINIFLKKKWFYSFIVSLLIAYGVNYFFLYLNNNHYRLVFSFLKHNIIWYIALSLLISIGFNWLVFRKSYISICNSK